MKRTLKSKLIILLIPFLMGFTEDGCDFLNFLFSLTYTPDNDIEEIVPNAIVTGSFPLYREIKIYDDGLIFIGYGFKDDKRIHLSGSPDLNDITNNRSVEPNFDNIIVGDNGTLVMLFFDSDNIGYLFNPAGTHNLNAVTDPFKNLFDAYDSTFYAVGDSGTVIKSTDNGLSWEKLNFPSNENLRDVFIKEHFSHGEDSVEVYVSGDNYTAMKSPDGGETWIPVTTEEGENRIPAKLSKTSSAEYNSSYSKIYFYNDSIGYIAGPHGFILKTINGGSDWTGKFAQGFEQVTDLFFIAPDSGVAVGTNGIARFTTDGGETWFEDTSVTNYLAGRTVKRIVPFGDRYGVVLGEGNLNTFFAPDSTYLDSAGITITSVEEKINIPNEFALYQNYPNPFNPSTIIKYSIPAPPRSSPLAKGRMKEGFVTLKVYDVLGREIATLVNEIKQPGNYTVTFNASELTSGVYFYGIKTENFSRYKKMLLIK